MRRLKLVVAIAFVMLAVNSWGGSVWAQGPQPNVPPPPPPPPGRPDLANMPQCIDMLDSQVQGHRPGTACRVLAVPQSADLTTAESEPSLLLDVYRSGWTDRFTSESDSDLIEDHIKVDGFLYWWVGGSWSFEDDCSDPRDFATHAACRTYGSGSPHAQNGYHYFSKSGYGDQSFQTRDEWT